jgi:transposase
MVGAASSRHNGRRKESAIMARKHSIEFQDQACKLVSEQGYTQKKAATELGITAVTLREWQKKRGLFKPVEIVEPDYVASDDPKLLKSRIRELEKRLKRSETEKEILKKATAYFASQNP